MGILGRLLGSLRKDKPNDKPPIYGGDGLSEASPAIVNCASMRMAHGLIDRFISEKCGDDWERGIELTLASRGHPEKGIKMIAAKLPDGTEKQFYFDLSRPVGVSMKINRQQAKNRPQPQPRHTQSKNALPCEIHESDKDLVKQSDLNWWHSLEASEVMEMEQTDNVFKLAAYTKFREQGLDGHESAKKVRLSFLTYYGRIADRNDPRFNFQDQDVSLPYALKKRIDDGIASGRISKNELQSGTSINAVIREKIRENAL